MTHIPTFVVPPLPNTHTRNPICLYAVREGKVVVVILVILDAASHLPNGVPYKHRRYNLNVFAHLVAMVYDLWSLAPNNGTKSQGLGLGFEIKKCTIVIKFSSI